MRKTALGALLALLVLLACGFTIGNKSPLESKIKVDGTALVVQSGLNLTLPQLASAPSAAPSANSRLYFKTNGNLYKIDSGGSEVEIGGGGASSAAGTGDILSALSTAVTYTVTNDDACFVVGGKLIANGGTNNPFLTFNDDSAQTNYEQTYSFSVGGAVTYGQPSNSSIVVPDNLVHGEVADVTLNVCRFYDGSDTRVIATYTSQMPGGYMNGITKRTFSGDVALTEVNLVSNQTSGLAIGSQIQ